MHGTMKETWAGLRRLMELLSNSSNSADRRLVLLFRSQPDVQEVTALIPAVESVSVNKL